MAAHLSADGHRVCSNPFGTLFNPVSIYDSLLRLAEEQPFAEEDCIMMGAGAGLWCDFHHYTRFARATRQEFLEQANRSLADASAAYREADVLVLTFGTAWCFRYLPQGHPMSGRIVANCLKRPAAEFSRERLSVDDIVALYREVVRSQGTFGRPDIRPKRIIFTVSPIRHRADGLQGNMASKATLLLSCEQLCAPFLRSGADYFPAFELMLDELRDYACYATDGVHPSPESVRYIYGRFKKF